jgi:hypothetical protein
MGNQKLYIEEGQTIQLSTEKEKKEQHIIYKTLHRKLKIEQHELNENPWVNTEWQRSSCFTCGTRRVTLATNMGINHK